MKRHQNPSLSSFPLRLAAVLACIAMLTSAAHAIVAEEDTVLPEDAIGTELTRSTLAKFKFEGMPLSTTPDQFLQKFPQAKRVDEQVEDKLGMRCYVVNGLKSADSAQFYFIADKLYQIEINYDLPRLEAQGGVAAVVRKLVKDFGNPDGVLGNRRTWQQPNIGLRADFYTSRQGAQLLITNTRYSALVNERQTKTALEENPQIGF